MQDQDFDKLFAHKMRQVGGKSPNEGEWAAIFERLDAHQNRRSRWVLPLLFALFALLAGGNVFWWMAWRGAENRFSETKKSVVMADTVVRRTVIFQVDTVYKTVEIRRRVSQVFDENEPSFSPNDASNFSSKSFLKNENNPSIETFAGAEKISVSGFSKTENQNAFQFLDSSQTEENQRLKLQIAALEQQDSISGNVDFKTENQLSVIAAVADSLAQKQAAGDSLCQNLLAQRDIEKSRRRPLFVLAAPDLGIGGGVCLPQMPGKISGYGKQLGASGSVEIMRGWRFWAAVSRQSTSLKSKDTSSFSEDLVPQPGNEFALKYWEISEIKNWETSAGLRYEWHNRLIFKPFVGIGIRRWQVDELKAKFEFRNLQNGSETEIEVEIPADKNRLGLLAEIGGNVWLSRRVGLGNKVFWRSAGQHLRLPDWGLGFETRLFYRFGK